MPSLSGVSVDQLEEICQSLTPPDPEIVTKIELAKSGVILRMSHSGHPDRAATVFAEITGWMEMSIDGGYGIFIIDEDATAEEFRDYAADYVSLGVKYLRDGAVEKRTKILRVPMQVLDADRGWRGVAQLKSTDAFRFVWRRLWGQR